MFWVLARAVFPVLWLVIVDPAWAQLGEPRNQGGAEFFGTETEQTEERWTSCSAGNEPAASRGIWNNVIDGVVFRTAAGCLEAINRVRAGNFDGIGIAPLGGLSRALRLVPDQDVSIQTSLFGLQCMATVRPAGDAPESGLGERVGVNGFFVCPYTAVIGRSGLGVYEVSGLVVVGLGVLFITVLIWAVYLLTRRFIRHASGQDEDPGRPMEAEDEEWIEKGLEEVTDWEVEVESGSASVRAEQPKRVDGYDGHGDVWGASQGDPRNAGSVR